MTTQTPNPEPSPTPNPEPTPTPNPEPGPTPPAATSPTPSATPPPSADWRVQRHAERMARREARREARRQMSAGYHYGWVGGVLLVLLGVIFLLQNLGIQVLANWWALLILFPAYWSYAASWNIYHNNGRMTQGAASLLTVGVLLTVLTLIFLLNLAFGAFWPILLIIGGLLLLLSAFFPR